MQSPVDIEIVSEFLGELVACPSVNPLHGTSDRSPYGESRLAALLTERLRPLSADVTLDEVMPGRPNFIAHFPGQDPDVALLLEAHADTVAVDQMTDPFTPKVSDGKLYGRGACDTKASLAAMVLAIEEVIRSDGQPPTDVYLAATCDEEHGGTGADALARSGRRFDAAIVGEPTGLSVVNVTKGAIRFRVTTHGQAAHSSCPEAGVSAIYAMRRILEVVEERIAPALGERIHPEVGPPKISVGTIHGGSQVNVVPAECVIEVDRRLVPGEKGEQAEAEVLEALGELRQDGKPLQLDCETTQYYPAFEQSADSPVVQCARAACESELGKAEMASAPWASNAGFFAQAGIPSVLIGPGSIDQAHKKVEFVELRQVADAVGIYARIIRSFDRFGRGE